MALDKPARTWSWLNDMGATDALEREGRTLTCFKRISPFRRIRKQFCFPQYCIALESFVSHWTTQAPNLGGAVWRRAGAPGVAPALALVPGTEKRPRPPPPFPFGMLILVQEFPALPRVPRPSLGLQSDVSSQASGSDYPLGRGRWAWPLQPLWAARPVLVI